MILVTGYLETTPGNYTKDPRLEMVPHLDWKGVLNTDIKMSVKNEEDVWVATNSMSGYQSMDMTQIPGLVDAYNNMINIVQNYIANELELKNPSCTFDVIPATGPTA